MSIHIRMYEISNALILTPSILGCPRQVELLWIISLNGFQ